MFTEIMIDGFVVEVCIAINAAILACVIGSYIYTFKTSTFLSLIFIFLCI